MNTKYLIVGGGIAGLYAALLINRKFNTNQIIVIEKEPILGGRIKSLNLPDITLELGAGVIGDNHKHVLDLVKFLQLTDTLSSIENHREYIFNNSMVDLKKVGFYDVINNIQKQLDEGKIDRNLALHYTLSGLLERQLNYKAAILMRDMYGYHGDFDSQNSIDGLKMFAQDGPFNKDRKYYHMKGGLSQIINRLADYLRSRGVMIKMETECTKIYDQYVDTNHGHITAETIILAIPKLWLMKVIDFPQIHAVSCKPLMRMYLVFPVENGKVWFHHLEGVTTTSSILRQIVPVNKQLGIIMIYVDNILAKNWLHMKQYTEKELVYHLRKLFNCPIPDPIKLYSHYCNEATHIWKPSVDSEAMYRTIYQPFKNRKLYIIGESYSTLQQWSEGALRTAADVVEMLT